MQHDIDRILISRASIAAKVEQVAQDIVDEFSDLDENQPLLIVPILTGSIVFVSDLVRAMPIYMKLRMISVSSYPGTSTTSQGARIRDGLTDLPDDLTGHAVLLVDDILDTGTTLKLVTEEISKRNPLRLRTCVLLRKDRPEARAFGVDHVCFDIPDEFVVGYGLDYDDRYRNLPEIATLRREVIDGGG